MRIRVIGVGTPRGDDAAGLAAAALVARGALPPGVGVRTCSRPAPDLVDALADADAVVILDATSPRGAPGRVRRLARDEIARAPRTSTHGLGVVEALELGEALGRGPHRVELIGIEMSELPRPAAPPDRDAGLSPPVERGVLEAAELARAVASQLAGEEGGPRTGA